MHLKGGLHIHSTCSDGELTLEEVIHVYSDLGFDFIALTDHDFLLQPDCYNLIEKINTDLIIFKGVELTVFEKGYVHVNKIEGDNEVLHVFNHPSELDLPMNKAIDRITAVAERLPIDAVEITSKGFRTPEFEIDDIPFPKVATDDSHTRLGCGRAWVEMDCMRDKDKIIAAIRQGDFWNCYTETNHLFSKKQA
jgi:PHP domain-containing protein